MASNKISYTTCESGDWAILRYEDFEASNHSISAHDWCNLLEFLGYEIERKEISDEEMEQMC